MPATVPRALFERALGSSAFQLWVGLCEDRNREGTVQCTKTDMEWWDLTPTQITRALRKLREAGLVRNDGWAGRNKPIWTVRGRLGKRSVRVPDMTKTWLSRANTHGGQRPGAGRPTCGVTTTDRPEGELHVEDNLLNDILQLANQVAPPEKNQVAPPTSTLYSGTALDLHSDPSDPRKDIGEAPMPESVSSGERSPEVPAGMERTASGSLRWSGYTREVATQAQAQRDVTRQVLEHPLVPRNPFLGFDGKILPSAPLLSPDDSPEEWAEVLGRLYTTATRKFWRGEGSYIFSKGVARTKLGAMMQSSAKALHKHNIAPAAWVHWQLSFSRFTRRADKPPYPQVIFSPKQIHKLAKMFHEQHDSRFDVRRVLPREADVRKLARDYARMEAELSKLAQVDEKLIAQIVDKHLPDAQVRVEEVRADCEEFNAEQRRLAAEGQFVWPTRVQ